MIQSGGHPEDISCIVDAGINNRGAIYISNLEAAQNPQTLRKFNIGGVITAAEGVLLCHPRQIVRYYKHIPAKDHHSFDISVYFEEAIKFIDETRKATNVLVHCVAGVSRSVALVLAYLIKNYKISLHEALTLVKSRRSIISPNSGFIKQLTLFHQTVFGPQSQRCHSQAQNRRLSSQKSMELQPFHKKNQSVSKNSRVLIDVKIIDRKIADIKNKYVPESLIQKFGEHLTRMPANRRQFYDFFPTKFSERLAPRKGMRF